jgi:hypothetical protein
MVPQVLQEVRDAFEPQDVEEHLKEVNGRVFGTVKVIGSQVFDQLDDVRRQRRLWDNLTRLFGNQWSQVGPIVLEPSKRG